MKNSNQKPLEFAPQSLRQAPLLTQRALATSVAGVMLMSGSLAAQETKPEQEESTVSGQLDPSVITADGQKKLKPEELGSPRYTAPLREIARTITVVPEELIKSQNATTVQDVLRNVPGISMQAGEGGTPAGDQLSIRGFSARTDFFVDGIRDIGGYTRDPFNFEQIEVSKGPSSTDSGRGSTGGSINLVTKAPTLEANRELTFGVGTDNFYRATLDFNQPLPFENSAFRLNLMGNTAHNSGRDYVKGQRWGIAPSIAFGLNTDTVFTLSYMHMTQDNQPDYGIPWVNNVAPDVDFHNYYGLLDRDYEDLKTDIFTAELSHQYSDNIKLRAIARYGRNHRDSFITAPRLVSGSITEVRRSDFKTRLQTNNIAAIAFDSNIQFKTGGLEHTIVTGIDYTAEKDQRTRRTDANLANAPDTSLGNPNPHDSYVTDIIVNGSTVGKSKTLGIFLYDTIKFNERWTLNGGVRYERFDSSYEGYTTRGSTVTNYDYEHVDNIISWRTSLTYKPAEHGSIYLAYGTSVNPSAEQLTLSGTTANLDPEESGTFELGTKWDLLDNRLGLTAALFRTNKTNARTRASRSDDYVLEGDIQVQGLELGITGQLTDKLSVFGGYTYLDSEIVKSLAGDEGNGLGNAPTHSFSIWANYELNEKLSLGGGLRYVGERDNGRGRIAADYTTVDLTTAYKISDDLSLQLNIQNLLDESYIDSVGGGHFIPGAGRSASVTMRYNF